MESGKVAKAGSSLLFYFVSSLVDGSVIQHLVKDRRGHRRKKRRLPVPDDDDDDEVVRRYKVRVPLDTSARHCRSKTFCVPHCHWAARREIWNTTPQWARSEYLVLTYSERTRGVAQVACLFAPDGEMLLSAALLTSTSSISVRRCTLRSVGRLAAGG